MAVTINFIELATSMLCVAGMYYLHYQAPDAPIRHNNLCSGKSKPISLGGGRPLHSLYKALLIGAAFL